MVCAPTSSAHYVVRGQALRARQRLRAALELTVPESELEKSEQGSFRQDYLLGLQEDYAVPPDGPMGSWTIVIR
jgi:hypothetical protein